LSHYTRVATKIVRKSALIKALQNVGFQKHMIESSDSLMSLKGYAGDIRKQHAHIRIKGAGWGSAQNYVGPASNDLGFEQMSDGSFALHVSEYDSAKYGTEWQHKLIREYSREVIKEVAHEHNFFINNEIEEDGEIYIEVTSPF
jgi:hypothetical protein